ncbi:MAG: hypothetical protein R2787_16140 [Saprospiraceae bacterium]
MTETEELVGLRSGGIITILFGSGGKFQITNPKKQTNSKHQWSMTETEEMVGQRSGGIITALFGSGGKFQITNSKKQTRMPAARQAPISNTQ